jgi:hypothetical protein
MCIRRKTGERLGEPRLDISFQVSYTSIYILRQCANIVSIYDNQMIKKNT